MIRNLVYFGSPDFSAKILASLLKNPHLRVVGVVTQPDKPQGRKQSLTPSPVASLADRFDLPVYKPAVLDDNHLSHLKLLKPDLFLVVSYGKIIPSSWLKTPPLGTFNIHFSLLPRYRGALCISEAIKNQDRETGVTLMEMTEKLDQGPIIAEVKVKIDPEDDTADLTKKLTQSAESLLDHILPEICASKYTKTHQDEEQATYTKSYRSLTHLSAYIPLSQIIDATKGIASSATHALIRSLNPEPGAWTKNGSTEIKILKSSLHDEKLQLDLVQISGKNPTTWKQYLSGHNLTV